MMKWLLSLISWCFNLCIFSYFVSAIECMISWNEIEGVGDVEQTGQIIALVLGFGSLAQTGKNVYLEIRGAVKIIGTLVHLPSY